nr:PREDICTED: uncharacterized protein LOC107078544 isoform X3 [Lepisosteus oculatus]
MAGRAVLVCGPLGSGMTRKGWCSLFLVTFLTAPLCAADGISSHVTQRPPYTEARPGESVSFSCSVSVPGLDGLYVRRKFTQEGEVLFVNKDGTLTVQPGYTDRLITTGKLEDVKVTFKALTEGDSGVYVCEYIALDMDTASMKKHETSGTLLLVRGERLQQQQQPCDKDEALKLTPTLMLITGLSVSSVLLLCVMGFIIWQWPRLPNSRARKRSQVQSEMREKL